MLSSIGALLTEFAGVAGVGELFGVSRWYTIPVATVLLLAAAFLGRYRRVERIGILVGLAELAFIPAMILAGPRLGDVARGLLTTPLDHPGYVYLLAANVGAVIMPWMIFYQQTAVVDKGLPVSALPRERRDTAFGAVLTQVIMISVIVTFGATVFLAGTHPTLNTVGDMATAVGPFLGAMPARVLIGAAVLGGALVAALVVSLAGSWGVADVLGWRHSLNGRIDRGNWRFYAVYALAHIAGAILVLGAVDLVSLAVDVEVMNALLLPIVLGFLLALEAKALPKEHRMRGAYRWTVWTLCGVVMAFGLAMVPFALLTR
jgi:Mn2+/Fe2+ NRAMP family transporter